MRNRRFISLLVLGSLMLACNFPMFAPATQAPLESPTAKALDTATPVLPTFTPVPLASPTATVIPTPSIPEVTPLSVNVNCRLGPDVGYDANSVLVFGQTAQVVGRNDDSSWWYIHDPTNPGGFCWVSANVVSIAGPMAGIPIIAPPAAIVTKVTVDVSVPSSIFCGGPNPVGFSGNITTNGPAKVKFQWEITGDKSNTTSPETLNFNDAGTKDAPDPGAYNVDCGHYTITLHILSPNDVSAKKNFKISG
jgi:hypothetical protein